MIYLLKILTLLMLVNGCKFSPQLKKGIEEDSERSEIDAKSESIEVEAEVTASAGGAIKAKIIAYHANTQTVTPSKEHRAFGAKLYFPPGAFLDDIEVLMAEGSPIAHRTNLNALGVSESVNILSVGTPIVFTWTFDEESKRDIKIELPLPVSGSKLAEEGDSADYTLAVLYRANIADSDDTTLGYFDASEILEKEGKLIVSNKNYGIYQVVKFDGDVKGSNSVESKEELKTNSSSGREPPGIFSITGPVQDTEKTPYLPADTVVTWDPSNFVNFYNLNFAESDSCLDPIKSYRKLSEVSQSVSELESGTYYFCVTAINDNGGLSAANSGSLEIIIDTDIPGAPPTPASTISGINVTYYWDEPDDLGISGIGLYELQVGTTSGGSDEFNGAVTGLEKEIVGSSGTTLYARIRVVDGAGNYSKWSPVTTGETP
jgi:hypothetical protein